MTILSAQNSSCRNLERDIAIASNSRTCCTSASGLTTLHISRLMDSNQNCSAITKPWPRTNVILMKTTTTTQFGTQPRSDQTQASSLLVFACSASVVQHCANLSASYSILP
ncbi:hypothetical protein MRB53_038534 [Persea americana]|nr:hypothetical protein MRB53_038534 [Persea americana]